MQLPEQYRWLETIGPLPKMIACALSQLGVAEKPGAANNLTILRWAEECGLRPHYGADATAWCGLFMGWVAFKCGKPLPMDPLWALNWAKFGKGGGEPVLGDVLVFTRREGGHVGLYVAEDVAAFHVLGGNQADQVSIARIAKTRLHAVRQPPYLIRPASARPRMLAVPAVKLLQDEL